MCVRVDGFPALAWILAGDFWRVGRWKLVSDTDRVGGSWSGHAFKAYIQSDLLQAAIVGDLRERRVGGYLSGRKRDALPTYEEM